MKHIYPILFFLLILCAHLSAAPTDTISGSGLHGTNELSVGALSTNEHAVPQWFADAKFGIWAHWGPQCVEEIGDWMGRQMYMENHWQYAYHRAHYGHPSEFGFKDLLPLFRGEKWQPDSLVQFYQSVGAQYFFAMGNHHDNFDLWDSRYQPWNSMNIGMHRDVLGEWAAAAEKANLPFGISFHADHAWTWYETARRHDLTGAYQGVPYDGCLTLADSYTLNADSTPKWWRGLDPQQLYAQQHLPSDGYWCDTALWHQWEWGGGASLPTDSFQQSFFLRTLDALHRYHPDLVYFDATVVPFYPISNIGWQIVDSLYEQNANAVAFGKKLSPEQQQRLVLDVERAATDSILPQPWQSCTCLGDWHYSRGIYDNDAYKSAATVARLLMDIISKNGNLLLSVPMRADGTIDEKEVAILQEFGAWWHINQEAIVGSHPWLIYGETVPTIVKKTSLTKKAKKYNSPTTNEIATQNTQGVPHSANDIRFTTNNGALYAAAMAWPIDGQFRIPCLSQNSSLYPTKVHQVLLLGYGNVPFRQTSNGLLITLPQPINAILPIVKIE